MRASGPAMTVRSPRAGEYAAPPAHGPPITLICGTPAIACARKIARVGVQRADALLQPGAARVREADDRHAELGGLVDRAGDRLAAALTEGAALEAAVLRPGVDRAPVHASAAGEHAVADGGAHRPERAGVEQQLQAGTGHDGPRARPRGRRRRRRSSKLQGVRERGHGGGHTGGRGAALRLGDRQAGVLAAEPERVRQRHLEARRLARALGDVVEVALGVGAPRS